MSQNPAPGSLPTTHPGPWAPPRKSGGESSTVSQSQRDSKPKPPGRPEKETEERKGDAARSEEARRPRREVGNPKGRVDRQRTGIGRPRGEEEKLMREIRHKGDWIAKLEHNIRRIRSSHQEDVQRRTQHLQATEERLKRTEELLAARSAELSGAHAFLSTTDRLSEAEVLSIVHGLNEHIYQVAVSLTDGWEKLESSQATGPINVDPTSRSRIPILIHRARNQDTKGLTFLLQSRLCSQVVDMTSSWGHYQELGPVYQQLSASGGHYTIDPR